MEIKKKCLSGELQYSPSEFAVKIATLLDERRVKILPL